MDQRREREAVERLGAAAVRGENVARAAAREAVELLDLDVALVLRIDGPRLRTCGRALRPVLSRDDATRLAAACRRAAAGGQPRGVHAQAVPIAAGGERWGVLAAARRDEPLTAHVADRLARLAGLVAPLLLVGDARDRLAAESRSDALTGLPNRRLLTERLVDEAARAGRAGRPLSLVWLDLDDFKAVNDREGHAAGDALLRTVARRMLATVRRGSVVARQGGDEFTVLLPDTDLNGGYATAERLRQALAEDGVAASCGVAEWHDDESPEHLLRRADAALYAAKRGGGRHTRIDTAEDPAMPAALGAAARAPAELTLQAFLERAAAGDAPGLIDLADAYARERGLLAVWQELIHPALAESARRYASGELDRESRRLVELMVGQLVRLRPVQPPVGAPLVLLACAPPRRHALTLDAAAPLVTLAGWRPMVLPPPTSVEDIVATARRLQPLLVGLSAERPDDFASVAELVPRLVDAVPDVRIGIGRGLPPEREADEVPPPAALLASAADVYAFAAEALPRP